MLRFHARAALPAALLVTTLALHAPTATAHVTLETREYPAASTAKLVLKVPHGCEGAPTVSVRVRIPDTVLNVKPQPKAGWQLTTVKGKLATPITGEHGETITESVREVQWSGGRLEDGFYDEFVFRGQLPDQPGATIYFPVVQDCDKGVNRWIETPEAGKTRRDYKFPAPELRLLPKQ
jgi:periplasmic copper chaperone A